MKLLDEAFELVNKFKRYDPINKTFNEFPLKDYTVPKVDGLHFGVHHKGIDKVKPSTLEYIIYYLQNADVDMIFEAIIVLLYYYKVKKKNYKQMKSKFDLMTQHYRAEHDTDTPLATIRGEAIVYSVSFSVGSARVNKFGLTTDPKRYKKMMSDITTNYEFVSVGDFKVNQEIQFDTLKKAKAFEKEALYNLKKHDNYDKCKFFFDGYKESYLHIS